jgi:hypothetical protein
MYKCIPVNPSVMNDIPHNKIIDVREENPALSRTFDTACPILTAFGEVIFLWPVFVIY